VPELDRDAHRLVVDGLVERPLELSLADLRERFERVRVRATLHCAGNRRAQLIEVAPVPGHVPWREAAIGNAEWGGVRLRDVLTAAGILDGAGHVAAEGLDVSYEPGEPTRFGGSVPIGRDAVLADEMNGEPLPPLHGAPLRLVVPGYVGARSVKWLAQLTVQHEPSTNWFQAVSYRMQRTLDEPGYALGETAVNSAIARPENGGRMRAGSVAVEGWATSGGDRVVERVEVSVDGEWHEADLDGAPLAGAWRRWRVVVEVAPGEHELAARAWDSSAATQPEDPRGLWNPNGYANNAWHRVRVVCD
jgi:sulfite oxidase